MKNLFRKKILRFHFWSFSDTRKVKLWIPKSRRKSSQVWSYLANLSRLLLHSTYPCGSPGVNFTNILCPAFVPVGLRRSYCERRSWAYFLVGRNGKVGRSFDGETQQCQRMPTDTFALCARRLVKLTPECRFTHSDIRSICRMLKSLNKQLIAQKCVLFKSSG
jgi:hypothetical protein